MAIKDKVIIITSVSSGIGTATAKLLVEKGTKVVLAARREDKLWVLATEFTQNCGQPSMQLAI